MKSANINDIKIGMKLKNNDPRAKLQEVTVNLVGNGLVGYFTGKRQAWINVNRIYTDGKARHQGYNTIQG